VPEVDEIVKEFLVESAESLEQLDRDLVALERRPDDHELLGRIFRCIHTIKGTCGFLGFSTLESITHAGESLLARLRDGDRRLTAERTSGLLRLVDAVRGVLARIEATGAEGDADHADLIGTLTRLQDAAESNSEAPAVRDMGELLMARGAATRDQVAEAAVRQGRGDPRRIGEILVETAQVPPSAIVEALAAQAAAARATGSVTDGTVRVEVRILDRLLALVGELVAVRSDVLDHPATDSDARLSRAAQRLDRIAGELRDAVITSRMQPIGSLWGRLPRLVRDLALVCRKRVRIDLEGEAIELDRTVVDAIKDPLTHLVRNAVDHGIETPEARLAQGKPAEGRLLVRARQADGRVHLEVSDDGAGIDLETIKAKAVAKGILTIPRAARLSEREALTLVFVPGLSSVEEVSTLSGRGVGMDVVRTNVEGIGGTIDIVTAKGRGTTLRITIPLTVSLIPGLVVSAGADRFAIPRVSLLEVVRLDGDEVLRQIETVGGTPVYRLRGEPLPLVGLADVLALDPSQWTPASGCAVEIVVLRAAEATFGLVVDEVNEAREIVVKPLERQLEGTVPFSGATVMGDGRIALILDVNGIARLGGVRRSRVPSPAG
jgi:two-component system, chemotaxis family, sensor kinase CheA